MYLQSCGTVTSSWEKWYIIDNTDAFLKATSLSIVKEMLSGSHLSMDLIQRGQIFHCIKLSIENYSYFDCYCCLSEISKYKQKRTLRTIQSIETYTYIVKQILYLINPVNTSLESFHNTLKQDFVQMVKNELCIPLERGSNVLSTGEGIICLSPPSKLKIAVLFCSLYKKDNFVQCTSFLSEFHPMANDDYVT